MNQEDPRPAKSDEIDLNEFFRGIARGFRSIGRSVLFFLASIRSLFLSNRLFFGGIIICGLTLGAIYSELLKKKHYKSSMVLSCDYLNTQIMSNTIEKLNLLCSEPQREGLAEALNIDQKTAKNILSFEFEPFVSQDEVVEMERLREQLNNVLAEKQDMVDKVIKKLQIENRDAYQIEVLVYDPNIVKPLEKALVDYFRNNSYLKSRIEINYQNLEKRRTKLISDSRKLDSLKSVMFANYKNSSTSRGSGNVILGDEKFANPVDVFREGLLINKELLLVEEKLYVKPDFEVVDGFTTFKLPESASLAKILVISFLLSILVGYLIIGAAKFDRMLSKIDTSA